MSIAAEYTAYLYQALASKWGIVLRTDNVPVLRARLYKARAEAQDPDLACLQFRPNPYAQDSELWIVKGEHPNGQTRRSAEGAETHPSERG